MLTDTRNPVDAESSGSEEQAQPGSSPAAGTEATAPATPEGIATPETPAAATPDPYRLSDDLDPAKLVESNPALKRYLDSKAGEHGDRLSKRREADLERQIRERLEAESHQKYLDSLVDQDDLVGLGELAKRQRLAERQATQQSQASQQVARHADAILGQATVGAFEHLPKELGAILYAEDGTYKRWAPGGTRAEGIAALITAAAERLADMRIRQHFPHLKGSLEEAIRRESNGNALGEEPSPDTRSGAPASSRVITSADIGKLSQAEYEALFPTPNRPADGVIFRPRG